ncbi:MAG: hypothetical protein IT515_04790 [Burkholderiales bacterium]|nr:hypothetical protein [Burkholderiales bacterium]
MSDPRDTTQGSWAAQLDTVDQEIARLAAICQVQVLDPGVIERIIRNDISVCGSRNELAFKKLRAVIGMHYAVRDRALEDLGVEETNRIVIEIVARLRQKFGDKLGGRT